METSNNRVKTSAINGSLFAWIIAFFGLTGLGVLILQLTGVDQRRDFSPAIILIAYSPSFAALCVVGLFHGIDGVRSLLQPLGKWRVGIQWYVLVLLGPLVLALLTNVAMLVLGRTPPQQWIDFSALGSAAGPLIAGSLGEEIGWRGFAQPLLQKRFSPFRASILIG
ncbi:MAG TPA: hypothetical protein VFN35_00810, partial [Ktedonobacteraceae bacterium]|nr:hypothetical protein [Ktedonobacteraceae bacterium]